MEEKQKPSLIERRLYARILQIMEDKKPYLDPQFNLCQLANLACTNRTRLSSTLNNQTSFYRQFKEVTGNTPIEYFANLYYDNVNHSTK